MLEKFDMSKFVVCTDAGLSSATNRVFNSYDGEDGMRAYITTQPIKTLKGFLQEWCMADDGWTLDGDDTGKKYKISELDNEKDKDKDKIFYKTRWIKEEGIVHTDRGDKKQVIEQKLIVSYSIKYRDFMRHVREGQIERAKRIVESSMRYAHCCAHREAAVGLTIICGQIIKHLSRLRIILIPGGIITLMKGQP